MIIRLNEKLDFVYIFNFDKTAIDEAILRFRCSLKSIKSQNVNICISNNSETCIYDKISDIVPGVKYLHTKFSGNFSRALGLNFAVKNLVNSEYFFISDIDLVYSRDHIQRILQKSNSLNYSGDKIRFINYNYNLLPNLVYNKLSRFLSMIPYSSRFINRREIELPHLYTHEYEVLDQLPRSKGGYAHGNGLIHTQTFFEIQGYDEEMIGYGPEDDLFNIRISKINRIIYDNLNDTASFHLWHPRFHMIQFEKNMEIWRSRKLYYNSLIEPNISDLKANLNKTQWGEI